MAWIPAARSTPPSAPRHGDRHRRRDASAMVESDGTMLRTSKGRPSGRGARCMAVDRGRPRLGPVDRRGGVRRRGRSPSDLGPRRDAARRAIPAHDGFVVSIAMSADGTLVSAGTDRDPSLGRGRIGAGYLSGPACSRGKGRQAEAAVTNLLKHVSTWGGITCSASRRAPGRWRRRTSTQRRALGRRGIGALRRTSRHGFPPHARAGMGSERSTLHRRASSTVRSRCIEPTAWGRGNAATHSAPVLSVAWSASGNRLATTASDDRVRLWKLDGTLLAECRPARPSATAVASPARAALRHRERVGTGTAMADRRIAPLEDATGADGRIFTLALSPNGESLVAGGRDGSVRLFERSGGGKVVAHRIGTYIDDAVFSPRGDILAIAGNHKVEVLNADGSKRAEPFRACERTISAWRSSPARRRRHPVRDRERELWTRDGKPRGPLREPDQGKLAGSRCRRRPRLLASAGLDGSSAYGSTMRAARRPAFSGYAGHVG